MSQTKVTANLIATGAVPDEITKQSSDPTVSTNPSGGVGSIILNTSTGKMFVCTDATAGSNIWQAGVDGTVTPFIQASGGDSIVTDGDYKAHIFNSSADFVISSAGLSPNNVVEYLVIAGGGSGGGTYYSGGGGSGGYLTATGFSVSATTYSITVGAGGAANPGAVGLNGSDSVFSTITATGGGGGGLYLSNNAKNGGSGGGGARNGYAGGTGISGQGFAGGTGHSSGGSTGAGGGSATEVGPPGLSISEKVNDYSLAAAGASNSITGSAVTYAAGGRGSSSTTGSVNATANTGNGSDGGISTATGYSGGSGVVILRYKFQ